MSLTVRNTNFDWVLFNEIQPFFKNVVESIKLSILETFKNLKIKDFVNECSNEIEKDTSLVSVFYKFILSKIYFTN